MPVVRITRGGIISPRVPERAVIARIDRHLAIVAESDVVVLDATAVD
jgi:hypothetical protein